jgi:hypothetical protein
LISLLDSFFSLIKLDGLGFFLAAVSIWWTLKSSLLVC